MNYLQKQLFLTSVLFVTLLLCILAHWLLEPFAEWLDIGSISVYVYMVAEVIIIYFLLLPRIRLIINLDGLREGSTPDGQPSFLQMMAFVILMTSMVMLPFAAVNWINKIGKTVHVSDISQLKQMPTTRYVTLSSEVMAQLRPKPAQPVNYTNSRITYRYAYYSVLAPLDSTFNFVWLPAVYYSQDSLSDNMEQTWRNILNAVLTSQRVQYFRSIGANADKNKYYGMSLHMPNKRPVFFEKITGNAEQENTQNIFYLALLLVGSLLFYGMLIWVLPLNLPYANRLLQNKVPWWNPLIDRKVIPFKKYG